MKYKKMLTTMRKSNILLITVFFILSCSSSKHTGCEQRIRAYNESTRYGTFRSYYIDLPTNLTEKDSTGNYVEKEQGFIICKPFQLYNLLFKDSCTEVNFANSLFAMLVKNEDLVLNRDRFERIRPYFITRTDGNVYKYERENRLKKKYTQNHFITAVFSKNITSYQGRCILHGFLSKGYVVSIDDESGLILLHDNKTGVN